MATTRTTAGPASLHVLLSPLGYQGNQPMAPPPLPPRQQQQQEPGQSVITVSTIDVRPCDFYKHYVFVDEIDPRAPMSELPVLRWAWRELARKSVAFGIFYLFDQQEPLEQVEAKIEQIRNNVKEYLRMDSSTGIASLGASSENISHQEQSTSEPSPQKRPKEKTHVGEMLEVLPIHKISSSQTHPTMRGSLRVPLSGTWSCTLTTRTRGRST